MTRPTKMTAKKEKADTFTAEERAAMRERAQELKAEAKASKSRAEDESEALARIGRMPEPDRGLARKIHEIVKAHAPDLVPRIWYGMPAHARDGKAVCFFQDAAKSKSRYATLGFSDRARLDDGNLWPTSSAPKKLSAAEETKIAALVKKAAT